MKSYTFRCSVSVLGLLSTTTATFVDVVDPITRNAIEDPLSYFISVRQVSLSADFGILRLTD